ncbi:hypothetical protein ACN28E_27795 [Archangium lansingense]|uniref:hypothetical protein n=1 Tax=Archangium lansingense TaxID=2995310 RepID=UPI003B7D2A5F
MANDIKSIDIDVRVQMMDGNPCATWSFDREEGGRDATQVKLFSGQEYQVTYRLLDATSWRLAAVSLRRVYDSISAGFVTLTQGETMQTPQSLEDGAGTVSVTVFNPDALTLSITNALSSGSEAFTLGLSLTVSANSQGIPKQSSQDPQVVLEPVTIPPPPILVSA